MKYKEIINELLSHEESKPVKPRLPLVMLEKSTPSGLLTRLHVDRPNVMQASSEGENILKGNTLSQTGYHNAIWSGDTVKIDTKSEGAVTVVDARLTMNIMVQPSAFELFQKKDSIDVRGNGFFSRYLFDVPISNCGSRYANGVEYSNDKISAFNERVVELLNKSADLKDYTDKKTVCFSSEAKVIWLDVYNDIEYKMGPNGIYEYTRDHASKTPEIIARTAALIHCFDNSIDEDISARTLLEAIDLVGYFSGQFMKVFSAPPKYVVDANNLMQWFFTYTSSGVRYLKRNDILQFGPSGTRKKADLDEALNYLKHGNNLFEIRSKKTRVIDLMPRYKHDEVKLKQDLSLDMVF